MIVDKKLERPLNCSCGGVIDHYSIGYGPTPYMIHCPSCQMDLHKIIPSGIGGTPECAFERWNEYHDTVTWLKEQGCYKPSEARIREKMCNDLRAEAQRYKDQLREYSLVAKALSDSLEAVRAELDRIRKHL